MHWSSECTRDTYYISCIYSTHLKLIRSKKKEKKRRNILHCHHHRVYLK